MDSTKVLATLGTEIQDNFVTNKQVLSFADWFSLLGSSPKIHARNAAQYVLDAFEYYGVDESPFHEGAGLRWRLFDCPWENGKDRVVGQENVQAEIYRAIRTFARSGRINQLILLHGPNGSAKSSILACIQRAMEHYSTLDEGALYTFNWIFPTNTLSKTSLGFGSPEDALQSQSSYAGLHEDQIDARITSVLRDHPLLLIPKDKRQHVLNEICALNEISPEEFVLSEYVLNGDLSPRSRQIYDALLTTYQGDFDNLLKHVQVERVYISQRYRRAAVTVEPQMYVDASIQQVTSDRSFAALPASIQNISLYEPFGDLVDGNRGIIEFNDLLEKPLDSFKYLLATCEKSSVTLPTCILHLDTVLVATTNEKHLMGFKEHPGFMSFKGRMELIRTPYIRNYLVEQEIYDEQITEEIVGKHIAPHSTWAAALWATLTRMRKPNPEFYPEPLQELVGSITPLEKAELYATGETPQRLNFEQANGLRTIIPAMMGETSAHPDYEGVFGASPREMKTILFNAAHNANYPILSVASILEELEELVNDPSVYEFLQIEPSGEFYDHGEFINTVRERYLDLIDHEVRLAMGLVSENQYIDLFTRYVKQCSAVAKGEKVLNPITDSLEEPDESFMAETELNFESSKEAASFRNDVISRIGAWALDHPGETMDYERLFPDLFEQMRETYYQKQRATILRVKEDILRFLTDGPEALGKKEEKHIQEIFAVMIENFGYNHESTKEALLTLLLHRYAN